MVLRIKRERGCPECGLRIRAEGADEAQRLENHKQGWHHKRRVATLEAAARAKAKGA